MISDDSNTGVLRSALTKVVGGEWKIAVAGGANGGSDVAEAVAAPGEPDPRDEPDYEPGVRQAATPVDPETEAMRLLRDQLDARPLDG